jgi:hypothetical protein
MKQHSKPSILCPQHCGQKQVSVPQPWKDAAQEAAALKQSKRTTIN